MLITQNRAKTPTSEVNVSLCVHMEITNTIDNSNDNSNDNRNLLAVSSTSAVRQKSDKFSILTRFNKICHPSQRPRWQVDKEAIGLSRVHQCSSTYNPPS